MSDQLTRLGFPRFTKDDWVEEWLGAAMYDDSLSKDAQLFAALLEGQIELTKGQGIQSQLKLRGIIKLAAIKHSARLPYQRAEQATEFDYQ